MRYLLITITVLSVVCLSSTTWAQDRLLIIAPGDWLDELQPLVHFKQVTGRPTTLVSLNQVYGSSYGRDAPEVIKRYIYDAQQADGTLKYVMLVGDCDQFPVRYACRDLVPRGYQAADLYYADLAKAGGSFENWDGNGDSVFAQLNLSSGSNNVDGIDWRPDVALARVPASTAAEATRYVEKVIRYELAASGASWFQRAIMVTGDWGDGPGMKNHIASNYISGFTIIKHYHTDIWPLYPIDPNDVTGSMDARAAPLTQHINQGAGFLNYFGHGSVVDFAWVYDARHLDGLTNTNMLPVVFATACDTGHFAPSPPWQNYYDTGGVLHPAHAPDPNEVVATPAPVQPAVIDSEFNDTEARPEDWLVARDAGGIAYVGSAGTGNPGGYSEDQDENFFKAFWLGYRIFGQLWTYNQNAYIDTYTDASGNMSGSDEWHRAAAWNGLLRYMPFGDPTLVIGGAFTHALAGMVYDGYNGPLQAYHRYHVVGDVTAPTGATLTINPSASIWFNPGLKITGLDSQPSRGVAVNATEPQPVYMWTRGATTDPDHLVRGIKIGSQLRLRNGGQIKLN